MKKMAFYMNMLLFDTIFHRFHSVESSLIIMKAIFNLNISIWKILSEDGKNPTICDVMDRQTADCIGVHTAAIVNLPTLVYLLYSSFRAPSSVVGSLLER